MGKSTTKTARAGLSRRPLLSAVASSAMVLSGATLLAGEAAVPKSSAHKAVDVNVLARNGGWCWFQDPRAIVHKGKLVVGSVSGSGPQAGDVRVSVYDLLTHKDRGTYVLHAKLESDDHNAPAFYVRPDGRILAMYACHNGLVHYYRISEANAMPWSVAV